MPMSLKASCSINLGFPYHQHKTPAQSLSCLSSFLNEQKENGTKIDAELGNDHGARLLEDKMAKLLGTEAALWFPTGVLAQGIAARIHGQQMNNDQLLLHPSSHLLLHEEHGYGHAHGCSAKVIGKWREPLTSDDISGDPGCAFVELPQRHSGGKLPTGVNCKRSKTAAKHWVYRCTWMALGYGLADLFTTTDLMLILLQALTQYMYPSIKILVLWEVLY